MLYGMKSKLFQGISGIVLEIGSGTGINLQYLPNNIGYIGLDPNIYSWNYLRDDLSGKLSKSRLILAHAEKIPLIDDEIDVVISTFVLCTVKDQKQALREIIRVLKPGGNLLFIEHVAAEENTITRRLQHFFKSVWKIIDNGCDLERETENNIRCAGFRQVDIRRFSLPVLSILSNHIMGKATK